MLRTRILTAVVLVPLALALVWWASMPVFAGTFAVIALLAAWEWANLAGLTGVAGRAAYVVLIGCAIGLLYFADASGGGAAPLTPLAMTCLAAGALWIVLIVAVFRFPAGPELGGRPARALPLGLVVIAGTWASMVDARADASGALLVCYVFAIVWGADIGAYFAGRRFGQRKLAPKVSPGKTWEGVWGGVASGLLLALPLAAAAGLAQAWGWPLLILATLSLLAVSVLGDLAESVLKRERGVKDSGTIVPGHGGVLDRIDSLLAVAPCFIVWQLVLG